MGTLALAARGIDFPTLLRDLSRADLPLLMGLSFPIYLLTLWVRALRWRHLTNAVCEASRSTLFRATSIGALANNVLPLRIGEVVRAFYLSRETRGSTAALFGTVVLERGIDGVAVLAMALMIFGARGGADGGRARGRDPALRGRRAAARRRGVATGRTRSGRARRTLGARRAGRPRRRRSSG